MNSKQTTRSWFAGSLVTALALSLWTIGIAGSSATPHPKIAATADVPYQLTLRPLQISGLPGLHSVAHAVSGNKLVIVAGRTNGMHDFLPQRKAGLIWSFPPQKANDRIYVVDLATLRLDGSASVDTLPSWIAHQLRATNTQSFAKDGWFYIVGGYGVTADGKSMRTFDQVLAIDLAALIRTVGSGGKLDAQFARQHMHAGEHPALAVSGGAIEVLDDKVLLVFGQLFNGLYTTDGSVAQQEYSQAVRVLKFSPSAKPGQDQVPGIDVQYLGKCPNPPAATPQPTPDGPYHRRDFSLVTVLDPAIDPLTSRIGVFGGVFKGGRMEGYVHPVYLTPKSNFNCVTGKPEAGFKLENEDAASSQWLGQYEGPIIPLYDERQRAMYTTFLGGISQFYWDPKSRTLKHDTIDFTKNPPVDGLPFINSVSTLRVGGAGNADFLHIAEQFPPQGNEPSCLDSSGKPVKAPYLGTNSWFVMANGLPVKDEVILLARIRSPVVIGYIFGGIASTLPYPGKATCASNMIYAVTLDPTKPTTTVRLAAPPP
ncbi:MAG TPA: hypothetical protein VN380_09155 [Thermoanaerobaculia bacterium]|jgi:hypothetical protein|nr:hypothetical protein [Thermoanaerobaculia bacterium]